MSLVWNENHWPAYPPYSISTCIPYSCTSVSLISLWSYSPIHLNPSQFPYGHLPFSFLTAFMKKRFKLIETSSKVEMNTHFSCRVWRWVGLSSSIGSCKLPVKYFGFCPCYVDICTLALWTFIYHWMPFSSVGILLLSEMYKSVYLNYAWKKWMGF